MYGLWGYLLKAKALAPINARRVIEGEWMDDTLSSFELYSRWVPLNHVTYAYTFVPSSMATAVKLLRRFLF